jgi:glycerophosphoryl diester phosphodiesterase
MAAVAGVWIHFRAAFAYRLPLLASYLAIRLFSAALLAPAAALLLSVAIGLSGRSAVTDQDIAWFLLTPMGAIAALVAVTLGIAAAVLDVTVMTQVFVLHERRALPAVVRSFAFAVPRLPQLLHFCFGLVLRILVIALPFAVAAAAFAYVALGDYDISYYLTYHPPQAMLAAAIIVMMALGMGLLLLSRLVSWALALQLVVGRGFEPGSAFTMSAEMLMGRKLQLSRQIVAWLTVRILLAGAIAALFGVLIGAVPAVSGGSLRLTAGLTLVFLLVWALANAFVSAVSNGALARLLMTEFHEITGQDFPVAPASATDAGRRSAILGFLALALGCAVAGMIFDGNLLRRVGSPQMVEIIAHRGAAGTRPENTMAAVVKAIADGADWVEIDVQETADGEVVVAHDSDFMKSAGVDLKVWNATMADLARIDIGSWFDPAYAAERTPTLRDVLVAARGKAKVMIELKSYGHDVDLEGRVVRVVEETGMPRQIAAMSLKLPMVEKMHELRPAWRNGVLAAKAVGDLTRLGTNFVAVNVGQVSASLIRRSKAAGMSVYAWTVDDPVTMSRMMSMGVDGIITNQPARARQVMVQRNALSAPERLLLWLADSFGIGSFRLNADETDA